jgi:hypothetical protein
VTDQTPLDRKRSEMAMREIHAKDDRETFRARGGWLLLILVEMVVVWGLVITAGWF